MFYQFALFDNDHFIAYITNFVEAILLDATLPAGELEGADWGLTICPDGFVTARWPSPTCEGHRG